MSFGYSSLTFCLGPLLKAAIPHMVSSSLSAALTPSSLKQMDLVQRHSRRKMRRFFLQRSWSLLLRTWAAYSKSPLSFRIFWVDGERERAEEEPWEQIFPLSRSQAISPFFLSLPTTTKPWSESNCVKSCLLVNSNDRGRKKCIVSRIFRCRRGHWTCAHIRYKYFRDSAYRGTKKENWDVLIPQYELMNFVSSVMKVNLCD